MLGCTAPRSACGNRYSRHPARKAIIQGEPLAGSLLTRPTGSACAKSCCFPRSCLQALLLLGRPQPLSIAEAEQVSSLAPLCPKAADGFLLQPAVLQAVMSQCSDSTDAAAVVPAGLLAACLPFEATPVGSVAWTDNGTAVALVPAATGGLAGSLHGVHFCAAQQLPQLQEAAQLVDAAGLLYELEWQAAMGAEAALLAGPLQSHSAPALPSGRCAPALDLSKAASLAAADVVQVLQGSRTSPLQALVLRSAGSVPSQPTPGPSQPAVGAAAIAGVLRCLPYELPSLLSQLLDEDSHAVFEDASRGSGSRAYVLSASPLPAPLRADLYGVAVRGGTLHRPLLCYRSATAAPQGSSLSGSHAAGLALPASSTFAVTGGLGGLGLLTAGWLAGCGAPALLLLSRTGLAAGSADAGSITRSGALVAMAKCDASATEDAALLAHLATEQAKPFGGIMHTAGVQVGAAI